MKKLLLSIVVLLFSIVCSFASDVTLQWDASTEFDLAGYKIYYDIDSDAPYNGTGLIEGNSPIDIPLTSLVDISNPEFTLHGLNDYISHYITVTAYDTETPSLESDYSNEVTILYIYKEGAPTKPNNLRRFWLSVKNFFKWLNPWSANLRVTS